MIKKFIEAWDENKGNLEEYLKSHNQSEYSSYEKLLALLFDVVINPYLRGEGNFPVTYDEVEYCTDKIHVIDDGDYQGTQIFIIPKDSYQPCSYDYVWTCHDYGSCSGCDLLLSISDYGGELPSDEQVKRYMKLELNLLQNLNYLKNL